ncbi:MAG TPA: DUF4870 domain-containing protein [bacterium]|nr:DUF4870 domain-containing protein [bacterium]
MSEEPKESAPAPKSQNTGMAVIAYIIFFLPLLTDAKNDPFVKFHVKQGLVLLIFWVIISVLGTIIPFIGWFLIAPIGGLIALILLILGIVNALGGKETPLPMIGKYGESFKF